jgi:hypothetical protein
VRASNIRLLPVLFALLTVIFLLSPPAASAELKTSATISGYTSLLRSGGETYLNAILEGGFVLKSAGNKNVKGELEIKSALTDNYLFLDIPRAYIKVRFPWFRFTLGKTRVSWGDGFVFNAGDVIFGSMSAISADLTAETLRDETAWLGALYIPLGDFSFLEAVVVPYPTGAGAVLTGPGGAGDFVFTTVSVPALLDIGPVGLEYIGGGLRAAFKLGSTTVETGFFTSDFGGAHRPYMSLHGHLLVDWNFSASFGIPFGVPLQDVDWDQWDKWLSISAGLFHPIILSPSQTLSLRLETAIRPGADWAETPGGDYGLFLFPEISFSPSDTLSLQLRTMFSPIDLSALAMAGVNWNVYQGLNVITYLLLPFGDGNDFYQWDQDYLTSCTVGLEFVY